MARPPALVWAREVSHLSNAELANATGVTPGRVDEFGSGENTPHNRQLTLLATKLDRPCGSDRARRCSLLYWGS